MIQTSKEKLMVTRKELYLAEALLLSTMFRIDAVLAFGNCQNSYLIVSCALLIFLTASCCLWFLFTKRQWLWQLGRTLWKSETLGTMVTVSIILDLLPSVLQMESLNQYLYYVSWALSDIIPLVALLLYFKTDTSKKQTSPVI